MTATFANIGSSIAHSGSNIYTYICTQSPIIVTEYKLIAAAGLSHSETNNEEGNEQHEPYEVQNNRDDEDDMSDQGTEGHVTEQPSMHQPLDQGNGNSCRAPHCTASIINKPRDKCMLKNYTVWKSKAFPVFLLQSV